MVGSVFRLGHERVFELVQRLFDVSGHGDVNVPGIMISFDGQTAIKGVGVID
jgi:hypothetical protein